MSSINLRNQIEEDHLTCTICYNVFSKPKALPCLHTFCEHCLREFIVSRGYESLGEFPCPICRQTAQIPAGGIEQFPDNFIVKSLSETVKPKTKPTPKPRKSTQPPPENEPSETESEGAASARPHPHTEMKVPLPEDPVVSSSSFHDKWANAGPPPIVYGGVGGLHTPAQYDPPPYSVEAPQYPSSVPTPPGGLVDQSANFQNISISGRNPPPRPPYPAHFPNPYVPANTFANPYSGPGLYPTVPQPAAESPNLACSKGLQLQFGKKGASVTDFSKPFGLAISDSCDFVVTDTGSNRIFVFDFKGQPKKAFHSDCRIKDVVINSRNEILVVVNKPGVALRCFDMNGRFLGEHGKSITHDDLQGIALLWNGGVVVTGIQNNSIYILTEQYKFSSKFGRKGSGDGYFQSPAFVASNSRSHIIVSDSTNHNIQVFSREGQFKLRFGGKGSRPGLLLNPMGVCTDVKDNIIIADSGNFRVEMFTAQGTHLRSVITDTDKLGEDVHPVNVALTPCGDIAVLLNGKYFAEVRVYGSHSHSDNNCGAVPLNDSTWYQVN